MLGVYGGVRKAAPLRGDAVLFPFLEYGGHIGMPPLPGMRLRRHHVIATCRETCSKHFLFAGERFTSSVQRIVVKSTSAPSFELVLRERGRLKSLDSCKPCALECGIPLQTGPHQRKVLLRNYLNPLSDTHS